MKKFIDRNFSKKNPLYVFLLFSFIGLIIYSNTLTFSFVHDDVVFILNNPAIQQWGKLSDIFLNGGSFVGQSNPLVNNYYRPLLEIIYKLQYKLFGFDAFKYHFFNMAVHVINSLLAYILLKQLTKRQFLSIIVSLLFLVHPVQTETVACISGMSNLLFLFFLLGSMILYVKADGLLGNTKKWFLRGHAAFLFFIALFIKEHAIVLPFLLCLYEYYFSQRQQKKERRETIISVGIFFMIAGLYFVWRKMILGNAIALLFVSKGEFLLRLSSIPQACLMYMRIFLFPSDLHYYRSLNLLSLSMGSAYELMGILTTAYLLVRFLPKQESHLLAFSLGWFFIGLLPVINIIPLIHEYSYIAAFEHFSYLSSIGILLFLSVFVSYVLEKIFKERSKILHKATFVAVILLCSILTIRQNNFWKDEVSLFERAVRYEKNLGRLRLLLGKAYYFRAQYDRAIGEFKRSLAIMRSYIDKRQAPELRDFYLSFIKEIYFNLAHCYEKKEKYNEAIQAYQRLLFLGGNKAIVYGNLGAIFIRLNDLTKAQGYFQKALVFSPHNLELMNNLAVCYLQQGKNGKAKEILDAILEKDPQFGLARKNYQRMLDQGLIK